jgi:hypothetical protein
MLLVREGFFATIAQSLFLSLEERGDLTMAYLILYPLEWINAVLFFAIIIKGVFSSLMMMGINELSEERMLAIYWLLSIVAIILGILSYLRISKKRLQRIKELNISASIIFILVYLVILPPMLFFALFLFVGNS